MKITCPKCQKDNEFIVNGGAKCRHCSKPLDGYIFIKPLVPAFLLIALAIGGTHTVEHFTEENRYPSVFEFALIDQCISADDRIWRHEGVFFEKKRDACLRALEKTQKDFSYSDFKDDQSKFIRKFQEHIRSGATK